MFEVSLDVNIGLRVLSTRTEHPLVEGVRFGKETANK